MRDRREGVTEQTDIQRLLGRFNEGVKRGVYRGVVVVLRAVVSRSDGRDLTSGHDGSGQVVIDVGINAGQRELDAGQRGLIAAVEQGLPAGGRGLAGEGGLER